MQCRSALLNIEVYDHGGVLPVRAPRGLGVPAGLDQAHERPGSGRQRRSLIGVTGAIAVIVAPFGHQRIEVRGQRGVELRGVMVIKCDPITAALLGGWSW